VYLAKQHAVAHINKPARVAKGTANRPWGLGGCATW
jgi:hypothetical protein